MMEPILRDLSMRPSKDQILASIEKFKEMLRIRKSTSLLGLREAKEVPPQAREVFPRLLRRFPPAWRPDIRCDARS